MKDINFFKGKDFLYFKRVFSKAEVLKEDECGTPLGHENLQAGGFLIESSEGEARKIIAMLKDKKFSGKIALVGGDDAFNRRAIESLKIDYLVSVEKKVGADTLKQRDSGLNHVVAKTASEKGVRIVVNMSEVSSLKGKERAERISKIIQNVKICRKVGCGIRIASFAKDKKGVFGEVGRKSFGVSVGMSSSEVRDSVNF
jgi:RNase P/RNase MRP subunit p30